MLTVTVLDRRHTLFQGSATAVSSTNSQGPFDILENHSNFIAACQDNIVVHTDSGDKSFPAKSGLIRVFDNHVQVYLGV